MKSRRFKIRTEKIASSELPGSQSKNSDTIDRNQQMQQFFEMFKTFIKKMVPENQKVWHSDQYLEARDREAMVKLPVVQDDLMTQKSLKRWTTQVFRKVFSTAFNAFSRNEMSFEQAKIYCSEHIFRNLVDLNQKYTFRAKDFQIVDRHIAGGLLTYMSKKYPLTDSTEINKKLQEVLHEVDNIEALSNDYMASTKVIFQYRQDGNYNDLIMKFFNQLTDLIEKESQDEQTNYQHFQQFMTTLFEQVMDDDWMGSHELVEKIKVDRSSSLIESPKKHQQKYDLKESLQSKLQKKEKYRATVKEYTSYLIGRKIPENIPHYSEKEIKSKNLSIKSPAILRILTKWCEQLWRKFQEPGYYSNRSESIKVQKVEIVNSLLMWMRKDLDTRLQLEKEQILSFLNQIEINNYEMQATILKQEIESELGGEHLDQNQKTCGKFSTKIVKNIHSYIIAYLNRLIHGLMKVSKDFLQVNNLTDSIWPYPPNLLTFKIGDLMRCRCSSKEKQILKLYKEMLRMSKANPEFFKIVRIKNRLKQGTNDILMNIKFKDSILCEIQLTIKSHTSDFIKSSNLFHHYIYELQRANFGPLTELCSIWSSLDKRADIYQDLIEEQQSLLVKKVHVCSRLDKKLKMVTFQKPFICSECNVAYFHSNYLRSHIKCSQCQHFVCSNYQIFQRDINKLKEELIKDQSIRSHTLNKVSTQQPLPKYGLCIFLESK